MKKIKLLTLSVCLLFISNVCVNAENDNGTKGANIPIVGQEKDDKTRVFLQKVLTNTTTYCIIVYNHTRRIMYNAGNFSTHQFIGTGKL